MTRARRATAIVLITTVAGWAVAALSDAAAARNDGLGSAPAAFVYFFGFSGEFLKLRLGDLAVTSYWMLPRLPGAQDLLPSYIAPSQRAAEGWLPHALRYDANRGRVYGVFPGKGDTAPPIIAFQLPLFEVTGTISPAGTPAGPPVVLVSPDGSTVLVSYLEDTAENTPADMMLAVLERYDAASLHRQQRIEERVNRNDFMLAKVAIGALLSPDAYFGRDGRTIYDKGDTVVLDDNKAIRKHQNPLDSLSPAQRAQLHPFETTDSVTGKPWLEYGYADSAAGRVLLVLYDQQRKHSAFFSIDIESNTASAIIETTFSIGHLTSDGRRLVLEGAEIRVESGGSSAETTYKTGRFQIYDVAAGREARAFSHDELAGVGSQLLCIDPASTVMFYAARGGLYAVPLQRDALAVRVNSGFVADQWTACVFTDR